MNRIIAISFGFLLLVGLFSNIISESTSIVHSTEKFSDEDSDSQARYLRTDELIIPSQDTGLIVEIVSMPRDDSGRVVICGWFKGDGQLFGTSVSSVERSLFLAKLDYSLQLEEEVIVSQLDDEYYEYVQFYDIPGKIFPTACAFKNDIVVVVGEVEGHHNFSESNLSTISKPMKQPSSVKASFIWIQDEASSTESVEYFLGNILELRITNNSEILQLSQFDSEYYEYWFDNESWFETQIQKFRNVDILRNNSAGMELDLFYYNTSGLVSIEQLTSNLFYSAHTGLDSNCSLSDYHDIEFDQSQEFLYILAGGPRSPNAWQGNCKYIIDGIISPKVGVLWDQNVYFLKYSLLNSTWEVFDPFFVERTSDWGMRTGVPQMIIHEQSNRIFIAMDTPSEDFSVQGLNYSLPEPMQIMFLTTDLDGNVQNFSIHGNSSRHHAIGEMSLLENQIVISGWFCGQNIRDQQFERNATHCQTEFGSTTLQNQFHHEAFIGIMDLNGNWTEAISFGSDVEDNWKWYDSTTTFVKFTNNEFPSIITTLPDGRFLVALHSHADFEFEGQSITMKNSAIGVFSVDSDQDGIFDSDDNCRMIANPDQSNYDLDELGDHCDRDLDEDGVENDRDLCEFGVLGWTSDPSSDIDGDGCNDNEEDSDDDGDGRLDSTDNCHLISNPSQSDLDEDDIGDLCDEDIDGDSILNNVDVCEQGANSWISGMSTDHDGDGCRDSDEDEDDDDDGVLDADDLCPRGELDWTSSPLTDVDADGCMNGIEDSDDDGDGVPNRFDSHPGDPGRWIGFMHIAITGLIVASLVALAILKVKRRDSQ